MERVFHSDDPQDRAMLEMMVNVDPHIKLQFWDCDGYWADRLGNYYVIGVKGKIERRLYPFDVKNKYRIKPERNHE